MLRVGIIIAIVACCRVAAAAPWVASCDDRLHDAHLAYQGAIEDDFPRWDFGQWDWKSDKTGVHLHYYWREFDYQLDVTATARVAHPWRARWVRRDWLLERVKGGRVASVRASGAGALRDRDAFLAAFRPALEACLR